MNILLKTISETLDDVYFYISQKTHIEPLELKITDEITFQIIVDDEYNTLIAYVYNSGRVYPIGLKLILNEKGSIDQVYNFIRSHYPVISTQVSVIKRLINFIRGIFGK